jgi:ribonucleoside-diphosphate reductase alpha chain
MCIVRPNDDEEALLRKVKLAAVFGTIQSTMTDFHYVRPIWKENCEKERLLGVDLAGAMDNPLLRSGNADRAALLQRLKAAVIKTNVSWARRLNIAPSTATTCIKPGGNSSVRYGFGQSMSGWLSKYMLRNVEVGARNPVCQFLIDAGVPHEVSYRDSGTMIFSFPLAAPAGSQLVSDLIEDAAGNVTGTKPRRSAIQQLEDWLCFKQNWTEHNASISVYVNDDEWLEVGNWVYSHWDSVGGLAFFPLSGGVYRQAPMQPVSKTQYDAFVAKFPEIPWEKLPRYEAGVDHTNVLRESACAGGACSI